MFIFTFLFKIKKKTIFKMPQIDITTYSSTAYWLFILYFIYYIVLMLNAFPTLVNYIKLPEYKFLISSFYCLNLSIVKWENFLKIFSLRIKKIISL
jgi:hypothetical protein